MNPDQHIRLLQLAYANVLADAVLQMTIEGVLERVTERKRQEQIEQGAGTIATGDENGGLVAATGRNLLAANDQDARGVVSAVLDGLRELVQVVLLRRHVPRHRRHAGSL